MHASLLGLSSPVPDRLFSFLRDVADADQVEYIIGTWCLVAFDVDRQVAAYARDSWNRVVSIGSSSVVETTSKKKLGLDEGTLHRLWDLVNRSLLDPVGVYTYVNPPQPAAAPPPTQRKGARPIMPPAVKSQDASSRVKGDEDDESEADRKARLRTGAFGAAEWVLSASMYMTCSLTEPNASLPLPLPLPLHKNQNDKCGHRQTPTLSWWIETKKPNWQISSGLWVTPHFGRRCVTPRERRSHQTTSNRSASISLASGAPLGRFCSPWYRIAEVRLENGRLYRILLLC